MSDKQQNPSESKEKRQHRRVQSINLVSYICVDDEGNETGEGMGKTSDISLGGLLLWTFLPVETPYIIIMSVDLKGEMLEIRGEVRHCEKAGSGEYRVGIQFTGAGEEEKDTIIRFIRTFHYSQK